MDEYKQIASEGKETSMISKGKINKKFQNEEKDKEKSRMRTTLIGKRKRNKTRTWKIKSWIWKRENTSWEENITNDYGRKIKNGKTYFGEYKSWNAWKNCHHEWDW